MCKIGKTEGFREKSYNEYNCLGVSPRRWIQHHQRGVHIYYDPASVYHGLLERAQRICCNVRQSGLFSMLKFLQVLIIVSWILVEISAKRMMKCI